jgi:hypothetical protein
MIVSDAVKPRGKSRVLPEPSQVLVGLHKNVLGGVVRFGRPLQQGQTKPPDFFLVPAHQKGVGLPVPGKDLTDVAKIIKGRRIFSHGLLFLDDVGPGKVSLSEPADGSVLPF